MSVVNPSSSMTRWGNRIQIEGEDLEDGDLTGAEVASLVPSSSEMTMPFWWADPKAFQTNGKNQLVKVNTRIGSRRRLTAD